MAEREIDLDPDTLRGTQLARKARDEWERKHQKSRKILTPYKAPKGEKQVPLYQAMPTKREKRARKVNKWYRELEESFNQRMQEIKEMPDE